MFGDLDWRRAGLSASDELLVHCCICDTVSAAVNHVTAAIRRVGLRCTSGRVVEYRSWDREVAGWNLTRGYCARQLSMLSLRDRLIYIYIYICIYIYIFKTKGQNRPLICPWKTAVKNMLQKSDRSHRKLNYCVRGGHKPARWPWPTSAV